MNKYQRAIDDVARYCSEYRLGMEKPTKELTNELDILNELVERATPKKVKEYEDKYYACPICGNPLLPKWEVYPTKLTSRKNGLPVCLNCLQRLDWSEEDVD